jgi:hypothetical protein
MNRSVAVPEAHDIRASYIEFLSQRAWDTAKPVIKVFREYTRIAELPTRRNLGNIATVASMKVCICSIKSPIANVPTRAFTHVLAESILQASKTQTSRFRHFGQVYCSIQMRFNEIYSLTN